MYTKVLAMFLKRKLYGSQFQEEWEQKEGASSTLTNTGVVR